MVGARLIETSPSVTTKDDAVMVGFCDDSYNGAKGRSWFATDEVSEPSEGLPAELAGNESTQIGWTFTATTLLDESPSAAHLVDERIREWSTCQPKDDTPLTTQKVTVAGAAASVVRTQEVRGVSAWNAHAASGVARVENALVSCTINARTAKLALAMTTSCLTEMAQAVPFAAGRDVALTKANRVVAAKMLLARAAAKSQTVTVRTTGATTPCETSKSTFLPAGSAFALLETVPPEVDDPAKAEFPQILGVLMSERVADVAAARAKVAAARKTFGGCKGSFTRGAEPYVSTGKITGVARSPVGDGGFTITSTSLFPGQKKPEVVNEYIFSVGAYVVEMTGTSPRSAQAIAAQLKVVAGS
ncbi:hypothetical protein JNB_00395 [Janibacter sp. HTCC2649]|nr:hypothetical protein JNB_00395 [Janibacter sp. HTCC2649]